MFLYLLEAVVSRVGEYSPNLGAKSAGILAGQGRSLRFEVPQHIKGRLVCLHDALYEAPTAEVFNEFLDIRPAPAAQVSFASSPSLPRSAVSGYLSR